MNYVRGNLCTWQAGNDSHTTTVSQLSVCKINGLPAGGYDNSSTNFRDNRNTLQLYFWRITLLWLYPVPGTNIPTAMKNFPAPFCAWIKLEKKKLESVCVGKCWKIEHPRLVWCSCHLRWQLWNGIKIIRLCPAADWSGKGCSPKCHSVLITKLEA